ncbi:HNH endonuclease [Celeribacter indicus]|uniref:Putative restriction endonuclease n=2 Tax=Celeribacter indicus TaxID=1208324 RepID=A0A0B5E5L3_9RHOB|nr:hypothetical protein [Celeribacter indicus]AJE48296.1 putative restriction endonuclease [Celeribacter indicus]
MADAHTLFEPDGPPRRVDAGGTVFRLAEGGEQETGLIGYETRLARTHRVWERRGTSTRRVKEIRGLVCEGCGLDAEARFGRGIAMSCMEAHHLSPVARMPEEERPVRAEEFAVLCPTCHRVSHRLDRPDDLEGLRAIVQRSSLTPAFRRTGPGRDRR